MRNVDIALKSKYGISERELDEIVRTSKSQPEAIMKLRKKLTGSTKYDPRYFELERLLNAKWDVKTHGYLPDTHERLNRLEASMTLKPGEHIDAEGRIHKLPKYGPLPSPRRLLEEVKRNTGIKTVPKPQPKPSVVAKKVSITSTTPKPQPATVHVSQAKSADYRKLGMYALGAVVAFLVLKKVLR